MFKRSYEKLIPRLERDAVETVLEMESGYVLDFSDRTFDVFFFETVNIDPSAQPQLFNGRGTSKAKRLRSFIETASPHLVAKVLRELWEHREARNLGGSFINDKTQALYFSAIARLEGQVDQIDTTAIEAFEPNETLEELVADMVDNDRHAPRCPQPRPLPGSLQALLPQGHLLLVGPQGVLYVLMLTLPRTPERL